jgi:hypothetical protein
VRSDSADSEPPLDYFEISSTRRMDASLVWSLRATLPASSHMILSCSAGGDHPGGGRVKRLPPAAEVALDPNQPK